MANLLGPNILITGTNRGIGLGLVKELAKREGVHRIFAGYYSKISYTVNLYRVKIKFEELKEFEEQCSKVHAIELDVDCDESIKSAFDEVYESLGENSGLNLLVNDAAILEKVVCFYLKNVCYRTMRPFKIRTEKSVYDISMLTLWALL